MGVIAATDGVAGALAGGAPSRAAIDAAVRSLDAGSVVAVPTDTVYALIADVSYAGSADRLFAMKRRSRAYELPMLVADMEQAMSLSMDAPPVAGRLMDKFWPGPLTLVMPRHPDFVADLGSDDAETVGVRCPGNVIPRLICEEIGPLATTSANLRGYEPATTAAEVVELFGDAVDMVLDGGTCDGGPATVVDVTGEEPKLLREGSLPWADIRSVLA